MSRLRRGAREDEASQPSGAGALVRIAARVIACERCPRLRAYCEGIAAVRRRAYRDEVYWARPVPGFGDPTARVLALGLAPGAHGANRTGRMFTGDGSGDFLYPVLLETGFANQAHSRSRDDGLQLRDLWITAVLRCAPPGDKPAREEILNCSSHLHAELAALPALRTVVCLGRVAWESYLRLLQREGLVGRLSAFPFAHGAEFALPNGLVLLGSYHPSLRNTLTGRLTSTMLGAVFARAGQVAAEAGRSPS